MLMMTSVDSGALQEEVEAIWEEPSALAVYESAERTGQPWLLCCNISFNCWRALGFVGLDTCLFGYAVH